MEQFKLYAKMTTTRLCVSAFVVVDVVGAAASAVTMWSDITIDVCYSMKLNFGYSNP